MASYMTSAKEAFVPTQLYQPPIEALANMLSYKQGQYNAGFDAVKSSDSTLLNASLTKEANQMDREKYLTGAREQLKNLSSVDLSMSKNVAAAQSVYQPFFDDKDMQADMLSTRRNQQEISKFNSFKPEKGSFEYADQRNLQDMYNGMEKIRGAAKGDMSVYQDRRGFVPFTDLTAYTADLAEKMKFAVKSVDEKGQVVYKMQNGAKSMGNWTTFIDGATQDRFNGQFQVLARYEKEEGIKKAKHMITTLDPTRDARTVSDNEALSAYVKDSFATTYDKLHNHIIPEYQTSIGKIEKQIKDLANSDNPQAVQLAEQLNAERSAQMKALTGYIEQRDGVDPTKVDAYNKSVQAFMVNPEGNFFQKIRTTTISNLAKMYASNESQDVEPNKAFEMADKMRHEAVMENLAVQKGKNEDEEHRMKVAGVWNVDGNTPGGGSGGSNSGSGSGSGDKTGTKKQDYNTPIYQGNAGNMATAETPAQRFATEQTQRYDAAHNMILDPRYIARVLSDSSNGAVSFQDVSLFTGAMTTPGKGYSSYTPEEKAASDKVSKFLDNKGFNVSGKGKYGVSNAILAYAGKYFNELPPEEKWDANTVALHKQYAEARDLLVQHNALESQKSEMIKGYAKDPMFNKITVDRGGVRDFVNASDIAGNFKDIQAKDNKGNIVTLTAKQLGEAYLNNKLVASVTGTAMGGYYAGTSSKFKLNDVEYNLDPATMSSVMTGYNHVSSAMGDPKTISETLRKLQADVVPNLKGYQDKTGQMAQSFSIPMSKEGKGDILATRVVSQATLPGNFQNPRVDGVINNDVEPLIQKINTMSADTQKEFLSDVKWITKGSTGAPSMMISLKPDLTEKQLENLGITKDFVGKQIELPLNPASNAPDLQRFLHPSGGFLKFNNFLNGETLTADPFEKSLDFDYQVIPTKSAGKVVGAHIIINRKAYVFDPVNKKYDYVLNPDLNGKPYERDINIEDVNIDNIKESIDAEMTKHVNYNSGIMKQIKAQGQVKTENQRTVNTAISKIIDGWK